VPLLTRSGLVYFTILDIYQVGLLFLLSPHPKSLVCVNMLNLYLSASTETNGTTCAGRPVARANKVLESLFIRSQVRRPHLENKPGIGKLNHFIVIVELRNFY
jgi:hypothetical protein